MRKNSKNKKVTVPDGLSDQVGAMIEHFDDKIGFIAEQLSHVTEVVDKHTETLEVIKSDIELIKYGLKRKVDIDDFQALEHRVALLESRR